MSASKKRRAITGADVTTGQTIMHGGRWYTVLSMGKWNAQGQRPSRVRSTGGREGPLMIGRESAYLLAIPQAPRRRGRPAIGNPVPVRLTDAQTAAVARLTPPGGSRAETVRRLVQEALEARLAVPLSGLAPLAPQDPLDLGALASAVELGMAEAARRGQ